MVNELRRADLLPTGIPTPALAVLVVLTAAAWIGSHWLKGRTANPWQRRALLVVHVLLGTSAIWSAFQLAARFVVLSTTWSLLFTAFLPAVAIEVTIALYALERSMMPRLRGFLLVGLRIAMILLLGIMLAQPILWWETHTDVTRYAAVLLDDSASMHIADRALTPSEKLRLAALFDLRAVRNRPDMDSLPVELAGIREKLSRERPGIQAIPETDTAAFDAFLKTEGISLNKLVQNTVKNLNNAAATISKAIAASKTSPAGTEQELADIRARLAKSVIPKLADATTIVSGRSTARSKEQRQSLLQAMSTVIDELGQILQILPPLLTRSNEAFYRTLGPADITAVEEMASRTRAEIARDVLAAPKATSKSIIDLLKSKYTVRLIRFASEAVPADVDVWMKSSGKHALPELSTTGAVLDGAETTGPNAPDFQESTDIGAAIERVVDEVPAESLAGVLVLTDGRHNGRASPETAARRMGALGVPVCTVVIGSSETPKDAAVLDVVAPVSVYLGDKINMQVDLRFDSLKGKKAVVRLITDGQTVEETTVDVPEDVFRTSVKMSHTPTAVGIFDYEVQIEPMENEPMMNNNKWRFKVAASDNRMNVLLIEGRPRWEFRYLRNLLYARDRAVQLQYVLLEPDRLDGAPAQDRVNASASRKFGDAEATDLPGTREEWMRFDAIILGDIPPSVLGPQTMETIQHCVSQRGALLVVIAGQRFMPHWHTSAVLRELLPIQYALTEASCYEAPEPFYNIRLTADGNAHPIMEQAGNAQENRQIWESLPPLVWRHAVTGVKEGASVLAYAVPAGETLTAEAQAKLQKKSPLIAVQSYGLGRVLALACDETWRLRYRKGDVYHHKFWGQLLRWGVGDKLRSGTEHVRLGTDKLTYPITSPVRVEAKVLDSDFKAVTDEDVYINVFHNKKLVIRKQLQYRRDSCGLFETILPAMPEAGDYRVEMENERVARIIAADNATEVSTEFVVASAGNSVEFSELSTDMDTPRKMAGVSGGMVTGPESAETALEVFGPGSRRLSEVREVTLWDTWPLLLLLILVITAEWLLRRKGGIV